MPNSAKRILSTEDLDAIRRAQATVGNDALAEHAWTSVSSIQRTLRGQGGYDAVRRSLLLASREVLREKGEGTQDAQSTGQAAVSEPVTPAVAKKGRKPRAPKSTDSPVSEPSAPAAA